MADKEFKNNLITFPLEWKRHSNGGIIDSAKYRPDLSFNNENGKVVCVIESTSTNDRKVGDGELCLADKYFSDEGIEVILIFSLCGRSQYPPNMDNKSINIALWAKNALTCTGY